MSTFQSRIRTRTFSYAPFPAHISFIELKFDVREDKPFFELLVRFVSVNLSHTKYKKIKRMTHISPADVRRTALTSDIGDRVEPCSEIAVFRLAHRDVYSAQKIKGAQTKL